MRRAPAWQRRSRTSKPPLHPVRRRVTPGPPPLLPEPTGVAGAELVPLPGRSPEDVIVHVDGRLITGLDGGAIVAVDPSSRRTEVVADTGGRPLGLASLSEGRLLVCDSRRGLLRVDPGTGAVEILVDHVDGRTLRFCSNAVHTPDGAIWFTESTDSFGFEHYLGAFFEHRPSGRLFRRDPDGTVDTILDGLYFANGLTLTPDGSALLLAETSDYAVSRIPLTGPAQGRKEPVLTDLPGFPDNLSAFSGGRAWVPLTNPRDAMLDRLGDTPPAVRRLIWALPDRLQPAPATIAWALALDPAGAVVAQVCGGHPSFEMATGAVEHHGRLWLASIHHDALLSVPLPGE